ncbi:SDR family NAD(P)-dependent oxidoreductase [Tenuifilum thalassicum]|uniref:Glucose 1-dehydrogenase n=1 Tax=Tenuifilum thalassicum TaxID=2590900 RepID=A0A7D3XUY3_9BACT|nr:glucose 1-dehydrogenase [Tenuifilum thalassicum]QKG79468.1 glucose 1-dehydrogenase [Tenuifilum thalassicum]
MELKGKVVIVTGGARDIGREVSVKLAKLGAKVCVNYFDNKEDADETLKLIKEFGGEAIIAQGDMTKLADAERLVAETCAAFGDRVDGLVNVAGGLVARKTLEEIDENFYQFLFDVNFKTMLFAMKAAVPKMTNGGSIVNFSSQAARDGGGPGASLYASSKGAVATFTRSMAKELGPKNIRVNALCPGMIATSFHDRFTKPEVREKVAASTPLRREGKPEEVADLVAYLLSDDSTFITGANIDINGGLYFS